jgi:hypothetical protein
VSSTFAQPLSCGLIGAPGSVSGASSSEGLVSSDGFSGVEIMTPFRLTPREPPHASSCDLRQVGEELDGRLPESDPLLRQLIWRRVSLPACSATATMLLAT